MVDDRALAARQEIEREIQGRTLCDLLNDNAERHGDLPALSWKQDGAWQTASWRNYRERIAEAALGLAGLGVGKGDFVAIMVSNRPEHVIADQAAFHAGATPSTFYSTLAPEQIQYCAAHCEAKVAVLGISQSGQSPDIVGVLTTASKQGAVTVAVTNDPSSPLARASSATLPLFAGEEKAVAATKTYTTELLALAMLSVALEAHKRLTADVPAR